MQAKPVVVSYFSDLACIWAYVAQVKLDELQRNFGERLELDQRFVPVFSSVPAKIRARWAERGGYAGYGRHVQEIAARFDHVEVHPEIWTRNAPASSLGCHAFIRAASMLEREGRSVEARPQRAPSEELAWRLRLALFRDLRDIGRLDVQCAVAEELGWPVGDLRARVENGTAWAALAEDHEAAERGGVTGSPTFLLNEGRQKLYGNVGYRVLEANVEELLRDNSDQASWC